MNFSFLRVPAKSFEGGPLFRPRVALFLAGNGIKFGKNLEKAYFVYKTLNIVTYYQYKRNFEGILDY